MKKADASANGNNDASDRITQCIADLRDWRGKIIAQTRKVVLSVSPDIVEEWKWETPVWSLKGNVLAVGVFKEHLRLNFFKGAELADPNRLFNVGLDAKTSRGIELREGDRLNEHALKDMIRAAIALNQAPKKK